MHKSFRKQFLECKEKGNFKILKCDFCSEEIILCKKYHEKCSSSLCKEERK